MILISIPSSRLAAYGLHDRSTDREWLEAVANHNWSLGVKAKPEKQLAILTGEKSGDRAELVVLATVKVEDDGKLILTRDKFSDELDMRRNLRDSGLKLTRNPVSYLNRVIEFNQCACGCGIRVKGTFASGHDQKMLHDRINRYFGGSVLEAVREMDRHFGKDGNGS